MPLFFARVQLPGYPTEAQYEALHAQMANAAFYRAVYGRDGKFALPHGTYASDAYPTADAAAHAASAVARTVAVGAEVLTSGSDWQGLGLRKL